MLSTVPDSATTTGAHCYLVAGIHVPESSWLAVALAAVFAASGLGFGWLRVARLSEHHPTVEVRVADFCLAAERAAPIAALVRALFETSAKAWAAGDVVSVISCRDRNPTPRTALSLWLMRCRIDRPAVAPYRSPRAIWEGNPAVGKSSQTRPGFLLVPPVAVGVAAGGTEVGQCRPVMWAGTEDHVSRGR